MNLPSPSLIVRTLLAVPFLIWAPSSHSQDENPLPGWENLRSVKMSGDLRAFWNVEGAPLQASEALQIDFDPVNLLNDFSDYPGNHARDISTYVQRKQSATNPWDRPDFFEEIIRQNVGLIAAKSDLRTDGTSVFVHDIEFEFEQEVEKAWADPVTKKASGAVTLEAFREAYLAEWAKWFWLPCDLGKDALLNLPTGLYGPQPFRRDYWGIAGKDAEQIDGTHTLDEDFWKFIDPHVDFYIASIYVFYNDPGSVFYIASNIEENFKRTRQYGNKPVYAYSWLRYHNSNKEVGGQELAPWLVDATGVIPYFYGAKGNVLWGWEPQSQKTKLYGNLPIYVDSLGRVADLSEKLSNAQPAGDDEPAHVLWTEKRPLVKRMKVSDDEWIVLATNPWQAEDAISELEITCGKSKHTLELQGRHSDIFHIIGNVVKRLQVDYSKATALVNTSVQ